MTAGNQNNTDTHGLKNEIEGTGIPGIIKNPFNDELTNPCGVCLFKDRNTKVKYFKSNFFPPYDTAENMHIILESLSKKWDDENLCWIDL